MATSTTEHTGTLSFSQILAVPKEEPGHVVTGLLWEGRITVLSGGFAVGKTLLALQLSLCLSSGHDFVGRKVTRPYRTVFIDCENGVDVVKGRVRRQSQALALTGAEFEALDRNWIYAAACFPDDPLVAMHLDRGSPTDLDTFLTQQQPEIVIIDNLGFATSGDLQNEEEVKQLYSTLKDLRSRHESLQHGGFILLHHITKPSRELPKLSLLDGPREWLGQTRGSGRVLDFAECRLGMAEEGEGEGAYIVVNGINRGEPPLPLVLQLNPDLLLFEPHGDGQLRFDLLFEKCARRRKLFDLLPKHFTYTEARNTPDPESGRNFPNQTVSSTLKMAREAGFLNLENGQYSKMPI